MTSNYSYVNSQQIQKILSGCKLNSMTEIISFIVEHVSKLINFEPLAELSERVQELQQKPKGVDDVMIEEIQLIVEAMIKQREDIIRKDVETVIKQHQQYAHQYDHPNHSLQHSRRTLNQIDFFNFINTNTQSQQLKRPISNQSIPYPQCNQPENQLLNSLKQQIQGIKKQVQSIKAQNDRKCQQKNINELKNSIFQINKELSNKISLFETDQLISKFQKEIFENINVLSFQYQKIEHLLKKDLHQEMYQIKNQLHDLTKNKSNLSKMEKKIKKNQEKYIAVCQQNIQIKNQIKEFKKNYFDEITDINNLIQKIIEENNCQKLQNSKKLNNEMALWQASDETKNNFIAWERELMNNDKQNYEFEQNKSSLRVAKPGFYEISCTIFSNNMNSKKVPTLYLNSEVFLKLEQKDSHSNPLLCSFFLKEIVHIKQNRSILSIKVDPDESCSNVYFKIKKL